MKVFVEFPDTEEGINELEDRVAEFHATLLIEKLKQLKISGKSKKKLLNLILEHLEEQIKDEEQNKKRKNMNSSCS